MTEEDVIIIVFWSIFLIALVESYIDDWLERRRDRKWRRDNE